MSERYLVRCKSAPGYALAGIYTASLTPTGMVATWQQERAARYESESLAADVVRRLARKFTGSVWGVEPVEGGQ